MRLPIGQSDFKKIIDEEFDFVDKTLLVKELLEDNAEVVLITRPRRFGKTLNMSMLYYFFTNIIQERSIKNLFENLKITQYPKYMEFQGKHPVIFLSFKDLKEKSFDQMYARLCKTISDLYSDHRYVLKDNQFHEDRKNIYHSILNQNASQANIMDSLKNLTEYLYRYTQKKTIVLIDEYDTPIHSGYEHGYYNDAVNLFRNFLGSGLKDNPYLAKSVLTGILRISKENLFSGLNNLKVYSFSHSKYSEFFGFTEDEVTTLLDKARMKEKADQIKSWYNGYKIGENIIYNPWSVVNCISEKGIIKPYWINTSNNYLVKQLIIKSDTNFKNHFELLLRGKEVKQLINENLVFTDLDKDNELAIWSLLLTTGYLKIVSCEETINGSICHLAIPNQEIRNLYAQIIAQWLTQGAESYSHFITDLLKGNIHTFEKVLRYIFDNIASIHDLSKEPEAFYHGVIMGLTSVIGVVNSQYIIDSNRESGQGRYDYMILPKDSSQLAIIMEFKKVDLGKKKEDKRTFLKKQAEKALKQIDALEYEAKIRQHGIKNILCIGIAFSAKQFELESQKKSL
jgi:Predicted AAA-ATPase/PD-(D/E)XK nuclease superfamily